MKKIFSDKVLGVKADRPGLTDALEYIRPGDSLVVWRIDRLGSVYPELVNRLI